MNIKDKYLQLSNRKIDISLISEINLLKDQCLLEGNYEYFYLSNILIIDIYIDIDSLDDALTLTLKDFNKIDNIVFKNIYVSYLDRLIYIYIHKRNYKLASRYTYQKKKYIDTESRDEVNRWYLEMSYIYDEMNQKEHALANLKAILDNFPDQNLESIVLSNITKLYIDLNKLEEAESSLNDCLKVTKDEEGLLYCDYLLAKLSSLEGKDNNAIKLYQDFFNDISKIKNDYLNIANEYIGLLIKNNHLNEADSFITKIENKIISYNDLKVKKEFLKNKLRLVAYKNNFKQIDSLILEIESIDKQITENELLSVNENIEDYKNDGLDDEIKKIINKLENIINLVSLPMNQTSLRELLFDYTRRIELDGEFNEVTYVLLNRNYQYKFLNNQDVELFYYKNQRLYEKTIPIDNLKDSVVELVLNNSQEVSIELNKSFISLNDLWNNRKYSASNINYIYSIPLISNEDMFMIAVYSSYENDICSFDNSIILKIASKLLESKVIDLLKENNNEINIHTIDLLNNTDSGLVYIKNEKKYLSSKLRDILQLNKEISLDDFIKNIMKSDIDKIKESYDLIINKKPYEIEYKYSIDNKYLKLKEKCEAHFDGDGKYVCHLGTIKVLNDFSIYQYDDNRFTEKIEEMKKMKSLEFKFSLIRINSNNSIKEDIKQRFGDEVYYLEDNTFIVILENEVNQKTLDKYVKDLKDNYSIIRFPRDLVDIDEVIKFSKICLNNNIKYFTEDIYTKYLKMNSMETYVTNTLKEPLQIWLMKLNSIDNNSYEVKSRIKGVSPKENVGDYITGNVLIDYETLLYKQIKEQGILNNLYMFLCSASIKKLINNNEFNISNVTCIINDYDKEVFNILDRDVFIDYKLIDKLNIFEFNKIKGICILEGITKEKRNTLIHLCSQYNLIIYSNYEYNDYNNNINRTDEIMKFEEN